MKIIKKIGLIAIILVVCLASTVPKINAYDFYHFNASSTNPGTILYRPLLNATLNRVITQGSTTYYSYPLTQQFYHNPSMSTTALYNSIYDNNLELKYRLFSIQNGIGQILRDNSNINDPNSTDYTDVLDFSYKSANVEYIDALTNPLDRFELTVDYSYFRASELYWSLNLYTTDISGSVDVKYIVEGIDDYTGVFKSLTYTTTIPLTITDNSTYYNIDYDPYNNINDLNIYGFGSIIPDRYSVQITPSSDFLGDFSSINNYLFNTMYVDNINYSLITQFLITHFNIDSGSNIPTPPIDNFDFTSWLVNSVGSFMNFEIFPGFRLSTMLGVVVAIPLLIYILKFFMGG